jgi:hypothetical protein
MTCIIESKRGANNRSRPAKLSPKGRNRGHLISASFDFLTAFDSRIAFTSTSGGTYYDQQGVEITAGSNTQRINHDSTTKAQKGLMIFAAQSESAVITDLSTIGGFPSAGTMFAEFCVPPLGYASNPRVIQFDNGSIDNSLRIILDQSQLSASFFYVTVSGATQCAIGNLVPLVAGSTAKVAVSWSTNIFRFACNGANATEDTSGTIPTVTRLQFGRGAGGMQLNCELRRVEIFNYQMTNEELQKLTQ